MPIAGGISADAARRIYDRLGPFYGWAERWEGAAKARALNLLALSPGQRALNVGVGTGREQAAIRRAVGAGGLAVGIDISPVMLRITRNLTGTPVCQADARSLPFKEAAFARLLCTYVLDLMPEPDLPGIVAEFFRVLRPGGRLVVVTLTEGVDLPSRALMALWRLLYGLNPVACGGCRPLSTVSLIRDAGFSVLSHEVIVQLGMPSEILLAVRPEVPTT